MKAIKKLVLLGVILLGYAACKKDDIFDAEEQFIRDTTLIEQYLAEKNIEAETHTSGLRYKITAEGTGDNATYGSTVVVKYTGTLLDGTEFDSNVGEAPFDFVLGRGEVIRGWDIGFELLNEGATAMFYVPSILAYGRTPPFGSKIPANAVLIFEVQLQNIR